MTDLAIYDMDRTVTRGATYTPFLVHCAAERSRWKLALAPAVALSMAAFGAKLIDRSKLKEINQRLLLGRSIDDDLLKPLVEGFADMTIRENVQPGAVRAIAHDRSEGRRLILATASYAFYAEAIAERLGFDDVIATRSRHAGDGRLIARIDGENCYGAAKLRMVERWAADEGFDRSTTHVRFYSDHCSDAPMFQWADERVAVNPDRKLTRLARERGWAIEDWSR